MFKIYKRSEDQRGEVPWVGHRPLSANGSAGGAHPTGSQGREDGRSCGLVNVRERGKTPGLRWSWVRSSRRGTSGPGTDGGLKLSPRDEKSKGISSGSL